RVAGRGGRADRGRRPDRLAVAAWPAADRFAAPAVFSPAAHWHPVHVADRQPSIITTVMASEYRLRRRVQFYETDAAGIVHVSWFFRYMEEAEHALWREAGLSIHVPGSEYGFPRVSTSFDFHRALRFEQEFDIHIRVTAITKKSIQYACELTEDR